MKATGIFAIIGVGAIAFFGFKAGKGNPDDEEHVNPDQGNLSEDKDWYKLQSQNLKAILKTGYSCPTFSNKFLEILKKLKNLDDWKQLMNVFGTYKLKFKTGDLIYYTRNVFTMCNQMNLLNREMKKRNIFVFSDSTPPTACDALFAMKRLNYNYFLTFINKDPNAKQKAKDCGLI